MPLQKLINLYQMMIESGDPRMNARPLIASPIPCILMTLAYLYFVKIGGPLWMKDRPAFGLRKLMVIYNFAMVIISTYMFVEMGKTLNWGLYCLKCQNIDLSTSTRAQRFLDLGYYFYLSKYLEFIDTIFFVLRKKYNQISSLHVYHHSVVPLTMCLGMKYEPGGNNSLFPFLNSGVHMVMYTYYGLSALGPQFQKWLFFKKYITTIQLTQFLIVLVHSFKNFLEGCDHSFFLYVNLFHASIFFYLFSSFYRQSYAKKINSIVKENIKTDQKVSINGQLIDHKLIDENGLKLPSGLRFRTIVDENSNTTIANYSNQSISVTQKEDKLKDK